MELKALHNRLEKLLRIQGGLYDLEDILHEIAVGRMQSFVEGDTWIVTSVHDYPKKRVLFVEFVVGELSEALEARKQIERFAAEQGCAFIETKGRRGWHEFGIERGWMPVATVFRKEL